MVYDYQNEVTMKPVFIDFTIIISNFAIDKSMHKPMGRMMMYRLLVACLLLLLPTVAGAYDFMVDGIYYNLVDGHAVVTNNGQTGCYSGEVVIPSTVTHDGTTYPVTALGHSAFKNCTSLTKAILPGSLTSIGPRVFESCTTLTNLIVPNSVVTMGANVFDKCYAIDSIVIGNKVTSLGDYMFNDCSALRSVIIGKSVTSLGQYAFRGCSSLTDVVLPNSVTTIGPWAFYGCSQLLSVALGSGVTSIDTHIFYNCNKMVSVTCLAATPPSVDYGLFFDSGMYYHAKLHVLPEAVDAYEGAEIWKLFFQIIGDAIIPVPEDVNGDGEVNIADANNVVVIIINGGSSGHGRPDGEPINADVNDDGEINIADINAIIDMILRGN